MKIAMVSDTYRPRINGVVTSIDTFAKEYRKLGHDVTIIAPEFPPEEMAKDKKDTSAEEYVIRIKSNQLFFDPEDRLPNPWSPTAVKTINDQILSQRFDIIHTQTPFTIGIEAIKWAKKMKCPIIQTYHTMFESYMHYFKFMPTAFSVPLARNISRWYCNKMDLNITPSTQMKDLLLKYKVTKPIEVNPTGIKIDLFKNYSRADFRKKNNISEDTTLLLFMGRVAPEKNIPFLFEVLKQILPWRPNTKLLIAGKGPAEEEVKDICHNEGLDDHVLYMGYFEPQDWVNCYAAADLFTFPSVTETQGLVVTEAMAVGTPVVAIGEMGVAEVMQSQKGGFLVDKNVDHFVEKVKLLLSDKELYAQKKKEAFEEAKAWSAHSMAVKMLEKYQRCIDEKNAKLASKKKK